MTNLTYRLRNAIEQPAQVSLDAMREAADHIETLETALRKLQNAAAAYVHPQRRISAEELIDLLLATVDDRELFRALREDSAMVNKALEGKK